MPCLNEELNVRQAITETLKAFNFYQLDGELILINDGSTDKTIDIINSEMKKDSRIKLINHPIAMGVGKSFFDGVDAATKDLIAMFPGDNENDPFDALSFIKISSHVDIIVPYIYNSEMRSLIRRAISSSYRAIINLSFGMNLNYTNGTVIYRTSVLRQISPRSKGFFYQAEILIRLIRNGYLYAETPNFLTKRSSGKTKALNFKSFFDIVFSYIVLIFEIHVFQRIGRTDTPLIKDSVTWSRIKFKS